MLTRQHGAMTSQGQLGNIEVILALHQRQLTKQGEQEDSSLAGEMQ